MVEHKIEQVQGAEDREVHVLERIIEYYDEEKKHVKEIRFLVDGLMSGDHRGFYPNGVRKFRYHYTKGIKHGSHYEYSENGKPLIRTYYFNGELSDSPTRAKPPFAKVICKYGVQEMLHWLKQAKKPFDYLPGDFKVHTISTRLSLFQTSQTCVACGAVATHFQLEWSKADSIPHLNMYTTILGRPVMMTRDHIIPKSLGGGNGLYNSQVMCSHCNSLKGNKYEYELDESFWKVKVVSATRASEESLR
jgi:HNH endonuclease